MLPLSSLPTSKALEEQPWVHTYIEEQLREDRIAAAIAAAKYVLLEKSTIGTVRAVSEKGLSCGMRKEIDQLLSHHALPSSGCSFGPEGPSDLVEKRRLFEQMASRCQPGLLRTMLNSQAEALHARTRMFIKHYEERPNPRA